jgi:Ca2+-transporting ATPase
MTVVQVLAINVLTDGRQRWRWRATRRHRDDAPRARRSGLLPPAVRPTLVIAGCVGLSGFTAFLAGRAFGGGVAQTMAFATIGVAELAFVFTCRSVREPAWRVPVNGYLVVGVLASLAVIAMTIYVPGLQEAFATVALSPEQAAVVLALAVAPFLAVEAGKAVMRRRARS